MDGPSRLTFPPHSFWRTLNVGNPPPQRLTEYMLVVTTSVATAATDTCCCTRLIVSFSFLIVSRLFHAHTVWPRLPIRATHTGNFPSRPSRLLVAAFLICHLSCASDDSDDETRRAINPRRGGQHSTVNRHRKASKAAHSPLKSIAYRHQRSSAVSTVSGRIRV